MSETSIAAIRRYARDPLAFFADLRIPGSGETRFGDIWAPFQVEAFEILAPCLLAVAHGRPPSVRGVWLERTKGASKDSDVGLCLLWLLLFSPRSLRIEVGADNQDQAGETHKAMWETMRCNEWMQQRLAFYRTRVVCEATESTCEFLTSTETGAHGSRPQVTVCNELSHVQSQAFMETMMDNAAKIPSNLAIIATNAGVERTWQWKWREAYRGNPRWYFQKVATPAPWISREALEEAAARNSRKRYLRLWQGVWATGEGDALDAADVAACTVHDSWLAPEEARAGGWWFVAGVDAGVRHDHAALVVLAVKPGRPIRLARCQSWAPGPGGKVDLEQLRRAVLAAHHDYGLVACHFDPSQMEYMAQELAVAGVYMNPVWFSGPNCNTMARDLLTTFRNRQIELYDDTELVDDLFRLTIVERKFGYKLEAIRDERGHADRAIALALVLPQALIIQQMDPAEWERARADRPEERIIT